MTNVRLKTVLSAVLLTLMLPSCALLKKGPDGSSPDQAIMLDTMVLDFSFQPEAPYRIPPSIEIDIHHVELDLNFEWETEAVHGVATLTLSAYATPQRIIELDARGFEIHELLVSQGDSLVSGEYIYDGLTLRITPKNVLGIKDTATIVVKYTARPALLEPTTGTAITSNQGLYFINPRGEKPNVPRQIWTQGEPECNSSWFPSVDHPHEKITHEIFLTVDKDLHTISNGKLIYSEEHENGTRTDYWKQSKPHANYLVMLAIGEFALVKDEWRDLDVWYYVDKEYRKYARDIFGNTPEMIEFYSNLLGYDYPWEKYHQVVVKDFVSGAMENTSAVIHGDFVQLTDRELLDESHEDVIAHELFHHWFGDLITCQSWSQLTMNEGFATYGEYLWWEHKYGVEEARLHLRADLVAYLTAAETNPKHLIRNRYELPDDIFDSHTYQKGGRVLHMLRHELGDSLFFGALNHYLNAHAFGSVQVDDFRKSVETISGRSLQWFFDQWYENLGHPQMKVTYKEKNGQLDISLTQFQSESWPTFMLHIPVTVGYEDGSISTHILWMNSRQDTFSLPLKEKPVWYSVDADGDMLWEMEEEKGMPIWKAQVRDGSSVIARERALDYLRSTNIAAAAKLGESLLSDPSWVMRSKGLSLMAYQKTWSESVKAQLIEVTQLDENSTVRASAYATLDSLSGQDASFEVLYAYGLKDRSFQVVETCLSILETNDPCFAVEHIKELEKEDGGDVALWVSRIYVACPEEGHQPFYEDIISDATGVDAYILIQDYAHYAVVMDYEASIESLKSSALKAYEREESWWVGAATLNALQSILNYYVKKIEAIEAMPDATMKDMEELTELRTKKSEVSSTFDKVYELHQTKESPFSY